MRDAFSIYGMLLISFLAGRVNFNHFYDGRGKPSVLNVLMTALVLLFWIAYLIINRKSKGYLIFSLSITVALLATLGLALVVSAVKVPHILEVLAMLSVVVFVSPLHGITGFSAPWLLPACGAILLVWLGLHGYFLYQIRRKRGACDEE
ncbi:MAG: hypothetical protein E7429_02100 [Ruminococcaceae bacterium]|nr:hypothetical protein [Oscillospiraceae bacterium]